MKAHRQLLLEKYKNKKRLFYYIDLLRLAAGEPIAYVVGKQPFLNIEIDLLYRPLIPRPETEYWLYEYVFPEINRREKSLKILDIFSGSGCIGLAVASNFKQAHVVLADRYLRSILQIKRNAKINNIKNIEIIKSNLFNHIDDRFDFILANPPYVNFSIRNVEGSVLMYEPLEAVFSRKSGLYLIEKFLTELHLYMKPRAVSFMEFSPEQIADIKNFLDNMQIYQYEFLKDQYNKYRVLKLRLINKLFTIKN